MINNWVGDGGGCKAVSIMAYFIAGDGQCWCEAMMEIQAGIPKCNLYSKTPATASGVISEEVIYQGIGVKVFGKCLELQSPDQSFFHSRVNSGQPLISFFLISQTKLLSSPKHMNYSV